jgi:transposase-like protein
MAVFKWTREKNEAARLYAERELSTYKIADKLGIDQSTLHRWKQHPEFMQRIGEIQAEIAAEVRRHGIAVLENRVKAAQERWLLMQQVIAERAESEQMRGVPGGQTGLLVHTVKGVGRGEDFQLVDLYEVDTALLNELRQHEKQAAQELGQWTEKQEFAQGRAVPKLGRMKKRRKDDGTDSLG